MRSSRNQSLRQTPQIGRQRSERSLIPTIDILKENVRSSFALGHLRGLVAPKYIPRDQPKTQIQMKRDQTFGKANEKSKNKKLTFLKFGFRTHEKKGNYYLQPLIRKVRDVYGAVANDGSMGVVDLWSDRNVNRLMDAISMTRDNLIVRKMGRELSENDFVQQQRMEEKRMKDRIMMDSMKLQSKEADTFSLKYMMSEKNKKMIDRISQPTQVTLMRNQINPNDNIQAIVSDIDQLHEENLVIYTDLYKKIKNIQKNLK